jgi:hypothetical protein
MAKTPEGIIKANCLRWLGKRGIFSWNNPSGVIRITPDRWIHFGKKGSSDIIGVLPDGKFLAIETKSIKGRLSPEQKAFIEKVRGLGGVAILARSMRELDEALCANGYTFSDMPLFNELAAQKTAMIR